MKNNGNVNMIKTNMKNVNKKKGFRSTCAALALMVMPVYAIAWFLFKTAVVRDNKSALMEAKWIKSLLFRAEGTLKSIKNGKTEKTKKIENGKNFADFKEEMENGKQWFFDQGRERITITSYDGLRLIAYYLPAKEVSDKVLILMHGYRNDGFGDFSGIVKFYHEMGYHILSPHQRSHGESEGNYICYGVKERYDVKQWAEYTAGRFEGNCKIFLAGISMGGASVLMASGLKLPDQVEGIIADCAFTSPWDIFSHVIKTQCQLPRFPFLQIADVICMIKAGFHFKECSTIRCMQSNQIPVLFIHGGKDHYVPTEMSYRNFDACIAEKKLLIVDNAAHGTSHLVDNRAYCSVVMEFLQKYEN